MLALLIQGCASTLALKPIPGAGQKHVFKQGKKALWSDKKILVLVYPATESFKSNERPTIIVSVYNKSGRSFDFSTDNIKAYSDGVEIKIYTYEELAEEIRRKYNRAALAAALSGLANSMSAANAGHTYSSGSYNSSIYSNTGGSAYGYGTYSGHTYNPAVAQQAQRAANAETQANMASIKQQSEQAMSNLSSTILRKETVMPKTWFGGYIKLDALSRPDEEHIINLVIKVRGESHRFKLKQMKIK